MQSIFTHNSGGDLWHCTQTFLFNLSVLTLRRSQCQAILCFVCSASGGREGGGSRAVCHEDQENAEGTWQQGSVHGLVQGQEEDCQLLAGQTPPRCSSATKTFSS